jgi:hypothetical protein
MKTILASVFLFAVALAPAAHAFPVQTGIQVTPQQVVFTVENIWNIPVVFTLWDLASLCDRTGRCWNFWIRHTDGSIGLRRGLLHRSSSGERRV